VPRSTRAALRNPVGTHVKVGPGLVRGTLKGARELGLEALQVFTGNPRGWALSDGRPAEDAAFREGCAESGIRVVVHAPYLVNLGSPTPLTYERSAASVAHNLRRAVEIGAEAVVVHTGSYVTPPGAGTDAPGLHDAALRRVREALLPILEAIEGDRTPWLLLEPTAGQGRSLCAGVEDLAAYLDALDHHPKVGVCLDTCHAFAAGAPLDEQGGTTRTVDRVVEIAGPGRLRLVHLNDSSDPRGSMRDRHERLGQGHIGTGAIAELLEHAATAGVPFILETPGSRDPGSDQIALVKMMRG
jgi:deoxyribonuclease-4